jgi:hypothetical protein
LSVDIVEAYRDALDADLSNATAVSSRAPTDERAHNHDVALR